MNDYKHYGVSEKLEGSMVLVCLLVMIISLVACGYGAARFFDRGHETSSLVDPTMLKIYSTQQLAEATYLANEELKRRAQGK